MMSDAAAISSSGVIVGTTVGPNYNNIATLWSSASAAPIELVAFGGLNSQAVAVNASGDVVGLAHLADNSTLHAVLWTGASHTAVDLGTLPGGAYSEAASINTAGDVVGLSEDAFYNTQAVLWPAAGRVPVILQSLGGRYSRANGINDNGDIVGMSKDASGYSHATLWPAAGRNPLDLGTIGGTFGSASAINPAGDIVGVSTDVGELRHATIWAAPAGAPASTCKSGGNSRSRSEHSGRSEHSNRSDRSDRSDRRRATAASATAPVSASAAAARVASDLGLLPGGTYSQAMGINASGQVVGFGENNSWEQRAMSWKSLSTTPPPAPGGTPGRDHEGNHQNEGDEDGDC
jgi:probable HAF family extracellular repeat protein